MTKPILTGALFTSLFMNPAVVYSNGTDSLLPTSLRGVWELLQLGPCRAPLETDTQTAIQIERKLIYRYEEIQEPVRISKISADPPSWRIDSRSDADDYQSLETEIYIINQYGNLTVANKNRTEVYVKCSSADDHLEVNDKPSK